VGYEPGSVRVFRFERDIASLASGLLGLAPNHWR
jgi:hypothetical protein